MKKILPLILLLICSSAYAQTYTVERVIDGDTIVVTTPEGKSEKVQLIGISAPDSGVEIGLDARNYLKAWIEEKEVRLEFDVDLNDDHGNMWAYVYFHDPRGMYDKSIHEVWDESIYLFINAAMVTTGYATPMTIPPNVKYAELFNRLHQEAFEKRRGLYKKWKEGVPDGTYYEYHKNGQISIEATYKNGDLINTKSFDIKGAIIVEDIHRPVACTMDAKQCPDGSYVGRVSPNCKFKACPDGKN